MASQKKETDDVLNLGKTLRQEKVMKKNVENMEKIKHEWREKKKEKAAFSFAMSTKHAYVLLCIILLIATGIRFYAGSMPATNDWANLVVTENLESQVTNRINEQYPTLSDAKKAELIAFGLAEAMGSEQNEQAVETLAEQYRQSYADPNGNPYLYEIDPYVFYGYALDPELELQPHFHNLLPFIEKAWHGFLSLFMDIEIEAAIFYLPLLFTLGCTIVLFLIVMELWGPLAAFFTSLFFVMQPLVLEFSMLGFIDTNMLNMFLILLSGYLFIKTARAYENKQHVHTALYGAGYFITVYVFYLTWSAWYIAVVLPAGAVIACTIISLIKQVPKWTQLEKSKKKQIGAIGLCLLILTIGVVVYAAQQEEGVSSLIPAKVRKYIGLSYENEYGAWPESFGSIKELRSVSLATLTEYVGGAQYLFFGCLGYLVFVIRRFKKMRDQEWYIVIGLVVFTFLGLRATRLIPYAIPFLAIGIGIAVAQIIQWCTSYIEQLTAVEKSIQKVILVLLVIAVLMMIAYPLVPQIQERSKLMPIMDDAIYNSAIEIKEISSEDAVITSWWDRGSFYWAIADRFVVLNAQPHMPTTYWLATLFTETDEQKAQNTLAMLSCQKEYHMYAALTSSMNMAQAVETMHNVLAQDPEQSVVELQNAMGDEFSAESFFCEEEKEMYLVVIDDLLGRYTGVQYFDAWDYEINMPNPRYEFTDLSEGGCARTSSGLYCEPSGNGILMNLTNMDNITIKATTFPEQVLIAYNQTVYQQTYDQQESGVSLVVYQRDGYWKSLLVPNDVANSLYIRLMFLDGFGFDGFEKVFEEVHVETAWVKVYKLSSQSSEDNTEETSSTT